MTNLIGCATCGYPLAPEERTTLVQINDKMYKPWVSLTDERKKELWISTRAAVPRYEVYAHLVEKELKELNI